MAVRKEELEQDVLYHRYMRALRVYGPPERNVPSPGHAIRSCARCGTTTMFRLDPEGTWYECMRCGHFA